MDNPELEAKRMIRDNMSSGEWNIEMLALDFNADFLRDIGFPEGELETMFNGTNMLDESQLDNVPEPPEDAITSRAIYG